MKRLFNNLIYILINLYIILLPILPSKFYFKSIPINGDSIFAIIFMAYFLKIIFTKKTRDSFFSGLKDFFFDYLTLGMLALGIVMLISTVYSPDKIISIKESFRFFTYIAIYFIIKYEIKGSKQIHCLIKSYIFSSSIVFFLGLIKYFIVVKGQHNTGYRLDSVLENSNNLAAFTILIIFPLIVLAIEERKMINRVIYATISLMGICNIILSQSRNSWIAFAVGGLVLCFMYSYKFALAFIIAGFVSLKIPLIYSRVLQFADAEQNLTRWQVWKTSFKIILDHPYFGIGNGNFFTKYKEYINMYPELLKIYRPITVLHPHNIFLKIQVEVGLLGTLFFLFIIINVPIKIKRLLTYISNDFYKNFYKGFLISYIMFILMNTIDNFFTAPKVITFFWLVIAISQSLNRDEDKYRALSL